jgi:hypothetical protein
MTACKSVEPNELTKSSIVGVAEGDGDGVVNDFDEVGDRPGKAGVDEAGEGDWVRRFAAKIHRKNSPTKSSDHANSSMLSVTAVIISRRKWQFEMNTRHGFVRARAGSDCRSQRGDCEH